MTEPAGMKKYRKADVVGQAFLDAAVSVGLDFLEQMTVEKIEQQGVRLNGRQIKNIRSQLELAVHGKGTPSITIHNWQWWKKHNLKIEFSEGDQQDLNELISGLTEAAPEILQDSLGPISEIVLGHLRRSWAAYKRKHDKDLSGFRKRLDRVWGKGLSLLDMLVVIAVEVCGEIVETETESTQPTLAFCHSRLHTRACQIANEAITLMRYGFADGAMARWRTLHEVAVVMNFLSEHGEEVAKRYLDHEAVESWKAAQLYQKKCPALGLDPFSQEEM